MFKNTYSKSIAISLVLLPSIVQLVIMMINGNNRDRYRCCRGIFAHSIPVGAGQCPRHQQYLYGYGGRAGNGFGGSAGSGNIIAVISVVSILLVHYKFGEHKNGVQELKITIPENLDYEGVFDDLFEKYLSSCELVRVRTINMGSLYQLQYQIMMKDNKAQKAFLDELRCRNGNLNIACGGCRRKRRTVKDSDSLRPAGKLLQAQSVKGKNMFIKKLQAFLLPLLIVGLLMGCAAAEDSTQNSTANRRLPRTIRLPAAASGDSDTTEVASTATIEASNDCFV